MLLTIPAMYRRENRQVKIAFKSFPWLAKQTNIHIHNIFVLQISI